MHSDFTPTVISCSPLDTGFLFHLRLKWQKIIIYQIESDKVPVFKRSINNREHNAVCDMLCICTILRYIRMLYYCEKPHQWTNVGRFHVQVIVIYYLQRDK